MVGWGRSRNKMIVLFIATCCMLSLYSLGLKIQHNMELAELDKMVRTVATVTSVVYLNTTFSGSDQSALRLLIHAQDEEFPTDIMCNTRNGSAVLSSPIRSQKVGPSRVLLGNCLSVDNPVSISISYDEFVVPIEPAIARQRQKSVTCVSYFTLYEDVASLRALLDFYSKDSDKVVVYVDSWHEHAAFEAMKFKNVKIVPWELLDSRQIVYPRTMYEALVPGSYYDSVAAALGDCWLNNAPFTDHITLLDLNNFKYNSLPVPQRLGSINSVFSWMEEGWLVDKLESAKVVKTTNMHLGLKSYCFSKTLESGCGPMKSMLKSKRHTSAKQETYRIRKSATSFNGLQSYADDLIRCVNSTVVARAPEYDGGEIVDDMPVDEPCLINTVRSPYPCRIASQTSKPIYRGDLKINVVQRKSMRKSYDGCHL